jgi:hypothetical protein
LRRSPILTDAALLADERLGRRAGVRCKLNILAPTFF